MCKSSIVIFLGQWTLLLQLIQINNRYSLLMGIYVDFEDTKNNKKIHLISCRWSQLSILQTAHQRNRW